MQEKNENNDEIYEKEQKYDFTHVGKAQLEKHLKNGGKIHGATIEGFRDVDFENNRKDKTIFEEIKRAIDVRQKDNFYFEMPKFSFTGEKKQKLIELLGNGKQYDCIKNGNILKINELYENDNNFEGNRALKERTMISFINGLPFDYLVYNDKVKGKGKKKVPLTVRQIKNRKEKLINAFKSDKYDYFLKVIYTNLICEINELTFYFGYVYCFEGLKDGIFDIGQTRFDTEYYLARYFKHTSWLHGKKSTCSSRFLLDTNGFDHLYSVLEITRGYYASKYDCEKALQAREGFFFTQYKNKGCKLINAKGSGETKKSTAKTDNRTCEFCGKKNVNYNVKRYTKKGGLNKTSHFNSKSCLAAQLELKEQEIQSLKEDLEREPDDY